MTRLPLRSFVALMAGFAVLLRLPSWLFALSADEAGYLMVARHWDPGPGGVFDPYFVDRAPQLIALIRLTDRIGGANGLRVLGAIGVVGLVLALARAAWLGAGLLARSPAEQDRAARVAAATGAFLTGQLYFDAFITKGELLGAPLVAVTYWAVFEALSTRGARQFLWAGLAGLSTTAALGMKQSLITGLAFGGVALLAAALTPRKGPLLTRPRAALLALAAALGAALPVLGTLLWARHTGVELNQLWYAVWEFRSGASRVINAGPSDEPTQLGQALIAAFAASGMGCAVLVTIDRWAQWWRAQPVIAVALATALAVDIFAVVVSGSYWPSYLLALIPTVGLGLGLVAAGPRRPNRRDLTRVAVTWIVVATLVSIPVRTLIQPRPSYDRTGDAIAAAAAPGDSIFVYGGRPDIVFSSGLKSPYPYLWSLIMRVQDPTLARLRGVLGSSQAPTWIVLRRPVGYYRIPEEAQFGGLLMSKYRYVGKVCNRPTYRLATAPRPTPIC